MRRSALLVIAATVFVDMLGFGIILPLLPFQTEKLGGSGLWVGALFTAYSGAQLVGAPILGTLSDRFGRRRLLLASLGGSVVSLAVTGVAGSLALLLTARVVAGLFGGSIAVGQAFVVDLTTDKQRTRALGLVGAAIGMGFVFGPAIGGALAGFGFATASLAAAGIALANLVAGVFLLPRTRPEPVPAGAARRRPTSPLATVSAALRRPALRGVLTVLFVVTFGFTSMEATFALLGARRFALTEADLGLVFSFVGVVMAVIQGGVVGRLADRLGDRRVALLGALLMGLALALIPFVPAWAAYASLGLLAVGQGLLSTTLSSLIAAGGGRELGGALGVGQSVSALARGIGPILAGEFYDLRLYLPYVIAAGLCVLGALLLARRQSAPAAITVSGGLPEPAPVQAR